MTIELMVFALWVAAIFLVFWQIVISIQFSRISGNLKVPIQEIEEGWNFDDIERLCQTMASEMVSGREIDVAHETDIAYEADVTHQSDPLDGPVSVGEYLAASHNHSHDTDETVNTEDYLKYLESRIDSLENLVDVSAGHFAPHMTQYGHIDDSYDHQFTDEHYIQPPKVAVNDWPTPVRLRRVR